MSKTPHNQRGNQKQLTKNNSQQVAVKQEVTQAWSGPLPPPEAIEKYTQIAPGSAERILAMAEKEQEHRIQHEKFALPSAVNESRRGQYSGAGISFAAVVGAIFTAYNGAHWSVPVALVGVPVLGIVKAIVNPRKDPE